MPPTWRLRARGRRYPAGAGRGRPPHGRGASPPRWRGSRTTPAGLLGGTWGGSTARSFWSRREIVQENAGRLASAQFGSAGVDSRPSARLLANIEPPQKLPETGSRFTDG